MQIFPATIIFPHAPFEPFFDKFICSIAQNVSIDPYMAESARGQDKADPVF